MKKGKKLSEIHKKNVLLAYQKLSEKAKKSRAEKISKANKGKKRTYKQKRKISIAKKGMKFSKEHKNNLKLK